MGGCCVVVELQHVRYYISVCSCFVVDIQQYLYPGISSGLVAGKNLSFVGLSPGEWLVIYNPRPGRTTISGEQRKTMLACLTHTSKHPTSKEREKKRVGVQAGK